MKNQKTYQLFIFQMNKKDNFPKCQIRKENILIVFHVSGAKTKVIYVKPFCDTDQDLEESQGESKRMIVKTEERVKGCEEKEVKIDGQNNDNN